MTSDRVNKPKVAIYGVGQFGQFATRLALEKGWPIVAAYNRAGAKIGQDLGQLAGLGKDIGVIVEDCDQADFSKLDADVAITCLSDRLSADMPAYERLLGAGVNVVSHAAEAYFPYGVDEDLAGKIDQLAKANGVTFTGTGVWDFSRIWAGLLVAGPCTQLESLYHKSTTDLERVGKELMMRGGVSLTQEQFAAALKGAGAAGGLYNTIPHHVLAALGYKVTSAVETIEPVLYDRPMYCKLLEKNLEPGIVCGTRIVANVETAEGVTARAEIELRLFEEGETEYMSWEIKGKPTTRIRIERDDSAHATTACLINRIPDVIAAEPGIQLLSQLGPMKPSALV